jgi:hypothetical protein
LNWHCSISPAVDGYWLQLQIDLKLFTLHPAHATAATKSNWMTFRKKKKKDCEVREFESGGVKK